MRDKAIWTTLIFCLGLLVVRAHAQEIPGGPPAPASVAPSAPDILLQDVLARDIPDPAAPADEGARLRFSIASTGQAPKIDGALDDACWRTATHAAGFYRFDGTAPVAQQTEAWITADKSHLYVAFHCLDHEPARILARETQRGGDVFSDDHVAVEIDSQNLRRSNSVFAVNARGTQKEILEGGTADNITWAGDWKAAVQRRPDGWTAEMSIPFALLRYPRGTKSFGMLLFRRVGRETSTTNWPFMPATGRTHETKIRYYPAFGGISPPLYAPRPVFLPYVLATGGQSSAARQGLDVKYPLSTTLTGVATLFPDFKTIEQDVTTINFSYTEKYVPDRRPFFAEGADFLPGTDLFYSRRIRDVDEGVKVVGKDGPTVVGVLGTNTRAGTGRSSLALLLGEELGQFTSVGLNLTADNQGGHPSNRVLRLYAGSGWQSGRDRYSVFAYTTPSWQGGKKKDSSDFWVFSNTARPGRPRFSVVHNDIGPNFVSDLGLVYDRDLRGHTVSVGQYNQFDRGRIELYDVGVDADSYQHHTGGFFRGGVAGHAYLQDRAGLGLSLSGSRSARRQDPTTEFHDEVQGVELSWGNKTLFQRGSVGDDFGRQAGKRYNFLSVGQGLLVSRAFSLRLRTGLLRLGEDRSTQTVLTGTYRLNGTQTVSGRLIQQTGGDGAGTNLYFAFGQRVRAGTDLYILVGDPNSPHTRGEVTVKMIRPF